jgi:hypothetical protein
MTHRFFGSMRTPAGETLLYLTNGDTPIAARPGVMLNSGYRIEEVTPREIRLLYPPLEHHASVVIPPPPRP